MISYTQKIADWSNATCDVCGEQGKAGDSDPMAIGPRAHSVVIPCWKCHRPYLTCYDCIEELNERYGPMNSASVLMIRWCKECCTHD